MLDKYLWQKYRIKKLSLKEKAIVITWVYVVRILQVCLKDKV
jgi:hypothetical protein